MRVKFEAQLERLNVELITMGALCEEVISGAAKALLDGDSGLRETVLAAERDINQKERDIESLCMKLLLQQQPVARDLRTVSAALKMVTDLQRIGDQCANIAELSLLWPGTTQKAQDLANIRAMSQKAAVMVKRSIFAYANRDVEAAKAVIDLDDEVDELFQRVKRELVELLVESREEADRAIDLIIIAKYLERIADHAVNIAQWGIYCVTGELVG